MPFFGGPTILPLASLAVRFATTGKPSHKQNLLKTSFRLPTPSAAVHIERSHVVQVSFLVLSFTRHFVPRSPSGRRAVRQRRNGLRLFNQSINQSINLYLNTVKSIRNLKIKNNLTILNKIQNLTTTNLTKTCFS